MRVRGGGLAFVSEFAFDLNDCVMSSASGSVLHLSAPPSFNYRFCRCTAGRTCHHLCSCPPLVGPIISPTSRGRQLCARLGPRFLELNRGTVLLSRFSAPAFYGNSRVHIATGHPGVGCSLSRFPSQPGGGVSRHSAPAFTAGGVLRFVHHIFYACTRFNPPAAVALTPDRR